MKHHFKTTAPACLAATLLLSACAGSLTVNEHTQSPNGNQFIQESSRHGQMETVVVGTLFGADKAAMTQSVTQAMPGTYHGPEMEFTATPEKNPLHVRTVFFMNSPRGMNVKSLCADPSTLMPHEGDEGLRMAGALCKGGQLIRSATARGAKPTSLDDPAFTTYVAAITSHLMSLRNTDRDCGDSPCSGS